MSIRLPVPIPTGTPAGVSVGTPTGVPLDAAGNSLIPELRGRAPTHNESEIISGEPIATGSTNVQEFWWNWENRRLFVRFLNGTLGYYANVPLSLAVAFLETSSHGRFVWNRLKDVSAYPWTRLEKGSGTRKKPQVVRRVRR